LHDAALQIEGAWRVERERWNMCVRRMFVAGGPSTTVWAGRRRRRRRRKVYSELTQ